MDLQLVKINFGKPKILCPVIAVQPDLVGIRVGKFLQGDMVLLLQLAVELVRVATVEVNERGLQDILLHLAQTAAGRLEHHVFGTVPLLGEDDPRQAAAVPALFPDLHQQNDADLGKGLVQAVKLHLTVRRLGILLIAFMKFQDTVRG